MLAIPILPIGLEHSADELAPGGEQAKKDRALYARSFSFLNQLYAKAYFAVLIAEDSISPILNAICSMQTSTPWPMLRQYPDPRRRH